MVKKKPNTNLIGWFANTSEENMYLSVINLGELFKGILKIPDSPKKNALKKWNLEL